MMSISFACKIGLPLVPMKFYLILLPDNQLSFIIHRVLNVPVSIQGMDTIVDFEV